MITKSCAVCLLLFVVPLRLHADDPADYAAISGTGTANPDDLCDWSEGHVLYAQGVKPPTPAEQAKSMKQMLLKLAARLVDDQQKTPDPQIKSIINDLHLDNAAALNALTPKEAQQKLVIAAVALLQAAKTDPLAAKVTEEFQIKEGPPSGAPATTPSTNAPSAAAT